MTENRLFFSDSVRNLCIRENWYTAGDCKDYDAMLRYVDENNGTLEAIKYVAEDIYNHSTSSEWDGYSKQDILENIAFHLVNDCCKTFIHF